MQITRTNPTSLNLNINIIITKRLGLELIELEIGPVLRILDLEASERIWVNHFASINSSKHLINNYSQFKSVQAFKTRKLQHGFESGMRGRGEEKKARAEIIKPLHPPHHFC
jgi:hypothetical protein